MKESDFSSFTPLTILPLQVKSIELIETVLKDKPMPLASQVTLIYAQLKGDFLRLKLGESNVHKDAVFGLLKLFYSLLKLAVVNYGNYCDKELIEKIYTWLNVQLIDELDWLKNEIEIINGLFLLATLFTSEALVTMIIENFNGHNYTDSLLKFLLISSSKNLEVYRLFHGSIEKSIHDLNVINKLPESIRISDMFPLMKLAIDEKKEITVVFMTFLTKLICFTEDTTLIKFTQITEMYSKLFWRSSRSTRDYCMTIFSSSLVNNFAVIPTQILQCVRSILESSDLPRGETGLIEQIQEIVRKFVIDEIFEVRLECGIVMGLMVKIFNEDDVEGIQDLFTQFMKHAMKSPNHSKSRVCYIMGLTTLKAHLDQENLKIIDLTSSTLMGLLTSWNRENDFEHKVQGQEIIASSIVALTLYLEKCGCLVNSEFYRDTCELLLEQVFLRQRCELTMKAVLGLSKCLGLYANLMSSQSEFIRTTVRLLAESSYLSCYQTLNIDLLVDISECNPVIVIPSELIYKLVARNVSAYKKGAFGRICQYFNLQISFDKNIAFELIDSGLCLGLLERTSILEGFDKEAQDAMTFLIQNVMSITLMERFDFWLESVFENLSLTERTKSAHLNTKTFSPKISLSDSAFSLTDLADSIDNETISFRQVAVIMIISSLNCNISDLIIASLNPSTLKRFLSCLIKICFNISAEKCHERKFSLSGIGLFRGIVKNFSRISESDGISILEPFDSQITSIISSILRASEEGDPLYAACAFGALFSLCSSRVDLQTDLKEENGRIYSLVKKSVIILKEQDIYWREEVVENLILVSIIIGLCSLHKSGFDISCLDSEIYSVLKHKIDECFEAYKDGQLEKNMRASLSGSDRLLLVETWTRLVNGSIEIDGVLSVLNGLNSENMESVCLLSTEIFKTIEVRVSDMELLTRLLNQILQFGLDKRDALVIDCIMELKQTNVSIEYLRRLSKEFLTANFSDFDTEFGLKAVKAQEFIVASEDDEDQSVLFDILRSNDTILESVFIILIYL